MFGRQGPAAAVLLVSLAPLVFDGKVRMSDGQSAHLHRVIRPSPQTTVTVQATTGTLTIAGWDRPDIEAEIVRHAPTPVRIEEIAAEIAVDGPAVRISAIQRAGQRDPRLTANITINAPRT